MLAFSWRRDFANLEMADVASGVKRAFGQLRVEPGTQDFHEFSHLTKQSIFTFSIAFKSARHDAAIGPNLGD
jgi:hypothetical protein